MNKLMIAMIACLASACGSETVTPFMDGDAAVLPMSDGDMEEPDSSIIEEDAEVPPLEDAGTMPMVDSGLVLADSGTELDGGAPPIDSGPPDSGPPDAGMDAGPECIEHVDCGINYICLSGICVTGCVTDEGCDDGNACTVDNCDEARRTCDHSIPVICDDSNQCTEDRCAPSTGCVFTPSPIDTICDDGYECTTRDRCDGAGRCVGPSGLPTCVRLAEPGMGALVDETMDCNPARMGMQVRLRALTNRSAGSGSIDFSGTYYASVPISATGEMILCADSVDGMHTPTVEVAGISNTPHSFWVDANPPPDPIVDLTVALTGVVGEANFTWSSPTDAGGFALDSFELRCNSSPITSESTWLTATDYSISEIPGPSGTVHSVDVFPFSSGTHYCMMRGRDIGGHLTPLGNLVSFTMP